MKLSIITVAIVILATACEQKRPDSPADPNPTASCETACLKLAELGCPEAVMTPGGTTCPTACRKAEQYVDLKHSCIVRASTVAQVRACGTVRCRDR